MNNNVIALLLVPFLAFAFLGISGFFPIPTSATINCQAGDIPITSKEELKEQTQHEKDNYKEGVTTKEYKKAETQACRELYKQNK